MGYGWLPSFIVGLWLLKNPGLGCFLVDEAAVVIWVLLRSCFGHARAKNNSELSCGLSRVHRLVGIVNRTSFLLHRTVKGLCCCGMQWLVFGLL